MPFHFITFQTLGNASLAAWPSWLIKTRHDRTPPRTIHFNGPHANCNFALNNEITSLSPSAKKKYSAKSTVGMSNAACREWKTCCYSISLFSLSLFLPFIQMQNSFFWSLVVDSFFSPKTFHLLMIHNQYPLKTADRNLINVYTISILVVVAAFFSPCILLLLVWIVFFLLQHFDCASTLFSLVLLLLLRFLLLIVSRDSSYRYERISIHINIQFRAVLFDFAPNFYFVHHLFCANIILYIPTEYIYKVIIIINWTNQWRSVPIHLNCYGILNKAYGSVFGDFVILAY